MKGVTAILHLLKNSTVNPMVNGMYPELVDENIQMPYISVLHTNLNPIHSKTSTAIIDVNEVRVQVNASTKREAKTIADEVRSVIDGLSNETVVTADESIYITRAYLTDYDEFIEHETSRIVNVAELVFNVRERRTDFIQL